MKKLFLIASLMIGFTLLAQNELPKVELSTLEGEITNLQDVAKDGQLTIVSLWATWCVPCLNELDAISEVYDDWQEDTNVNLVAISIDDSRTVKRVKPLINGKGWDYTILLDTNNDVRRALGAATVPLTLLVRDGKILFRHSGYSPGVENVLYENIQKFSK